MWVHTPSFDFDKAGRTLDFGCGMSLSRRTVLGIGRPHSAGSSTVAVRPGDASRTFEGVPPLAPAARRPPAAAHGTKRAA